MQLAAATTASTPQEKKTKNSTKGRSAKWYSISICGFVCLTGIATTASAQPNYDIINLGNIDTKTRRIQAEDINDLDQIVGTAFQLAPETRHVPFLWTNNELTRIVPIDVEISFFAFVINQGGIISGMEEVVAGGCGSSNAFTYSIQHEEFEPWEVINPRMNYVTGIDDLGRVVHTRGGQWCPDGSGHPYLFDNGSFTELPDLGDSSRTRGMNNFGEIVGWSRSTPLDDEHPVIWRDKIVEKIDTGLNSVQIFDINDEGVIVGSGASDALQVFLLLGKDRIDIEIMADRLPEVIDLNNANEVVGWRTMDSVRFGFIARNGKVFDLQDVVRQNGDWEKLLPTGINNAGRICGYGEYEGERRAFLLIPRDEFRTTGPIPGLAGQKNLIRAYNATPNGKVIFAYGFQRGSFIIQRICPGVEIGIDLPRVAGTAFADAEGTVGFNRHVASDLEGTTIFIQAIDMGSCQTSPIVVHHFPSE